LPWSVASATLAREVVRETQDIIQFRNGSALEISSNDASLVRGRSAIAVLGSETAHWKHDEASASNDEEVISARCRRWRCAPMAVCCA
jgi:hypothetical protein